MASLFFPPKPNVIIFFDGEKKREKQMVRIRGRTEPEELHVFSGRESVAGAIEVMSPPGKRIDHLGIKVEMIGMIEFYEDNNSSVKLTNVVRELEASGSFGDSKTYQFDFSAEKPHDSYSGIGLRLRYMIRVTITRSYGNTFTMDRDFAVHTVESAEVQALAAEAPVHAIKMEVGIEDCLHLEFEYNKQKYHLNDVIIGKIYFLLVKIAIKSMELCIVRMETAAYDGITYSETENVVKFELMDGTPVKGESVPIRVFLSSLDLTPSVKSVNKIFSVKYFLNLVLIDEQDRRYFKKQEVFFWRKSFDEDVVFFLADGPPSHTSPVKSSQSVLTKTSQGESGAEVMGKSGKSSGYIQASATSGTAPAARFANQQRNSYSESPYSGKML